MAINNVETFQGILRSLTSTARDSTEFYSGEVNTSTNPEQQESKSTESLLLDWINESNKELKQKVTSLEETTSSLLRVNSKLSNELELLATNTKETNDKLETDISKATTINNRTFWFGSLGLVGGAFGLFVFLFTEFKDVNAQATSLNISIANNTSQLEYIKDDVDSISDINSDVSKLKSDIKRVNGSIKAISSDIKELKFTTHDNKTDITHVNSKLAAALKG